MDMARSYFRTYMMVWERRVNYSALSEEVKQTALRTLQGNLSILDERGCFQGCLLWVTSSVVYFRHIGRANGATRAPIRVSQAHRMDQIVANKLEYSVGVVKVVKSRQMVVNSDWEVASLTFVPQ